MRILVYHELPHAVNEVRSDFTGREIVQIRELDLVKRNSPLFGRERENDPVVGVKSRTRIRVVGQFDDRALFHGQRFRDGDLAALAFRDLVVREQDGPGLKFKACRRVGAVCVASLDLRVLLDDRCAAHCDRLKQSSDRDSLAGASCKTAADD